VSPPLSLPQKPQVKDEIAKYKVGAPARVGLVAPNDVTIPGGGTGMDPSQTSFFQALNIATKINKGTIDIVNDVHLIKAGDKVGASEAALLGKLGIKPFKYGLEILKVYENGSLFDAAVLSITDEALLGSAAAALANVAALSLAANYPTLASIPHSVVNGYKNVLAIAVETDYSFPLADKVRAGRAGARGVFWGVRMLPLNRTVVWAGAQLRSTGARLPRARFASEAGDDQRYFSRTFFSGG
jgi:large subunit ribosomal protein LP0